MIVLSFLVQFPISDCFYHHKGITCYRAFSPQVVYVWSTCLVFMCSADIIISVSYLSKQSILSDRYSYHGIFDSFDQFALLKPHLWLQIRRVTLLLGVLLLSNRLLPIGYIFTILPYLIGKSHLSVSSE